MMAGLFETVAKVLEIPVEEISDDTSPKTTTKWDSLAHINIVLALEAAFGVKFANSEIVLINSLGAARGILQKKGVSV